MKVGMQPTIHGKDQSKLFPVSVLAPMRWPCRVPLVARSWDILSRFGQPLLSKQRACPQQFRSPSQSASGQALRSEVPIEPTTWTGLLHWTANNCTLH